MTALARSAPLGHPWPVRGLLQRGPAARIRAGASGRERGRAVRGAAVGPGFPPAPPAACGPHPTLEAGRCPGLTPHRGPLPPHLPPQLAGVPRGGAVVGSRPPPTPPGEGGAGPRVPAARLCLPARRCPEAGSASWVSAPVGKIAPRTRSVDAPLLFRSGDAWRETRPLPRWSSI